MTITNPADSLQEQNRKLVKIAQSLMRKVEQKDDDTGLAYQQFERAALLETQVRDRTRELERALDLLQESNGRLELANREIDTARANLQEAVESIHEGFALFDPDGRLIQFNSRLCRGMDDILDKLEAGLTFEDYVHLVSRSRFLSLPNDQSPGDWADHRLQLHVHPYVVFNVRLHSDRWMQVSEHRTSRGGTVILQTDVTEIMRLERLERDKMRDEQARMLQATLDHLNQGVCIFDSTARLVGWNKNMDGLLALPKRRMLSGVSLREILSSLSGELAFHDGFDAEKFVKWSKKRRKHPISFAFTRNGNRRFQVFSQEMPDRGFVVSFTDVTVEHEAKTAMRQMNEQLEQGVKERTAKLNDALAQAERANASKSRFMAAASHDLLQPLSAAKLFVSSLSDRITDDLSASILDRTQSALVGVEEIIEALLDISRLDTGQDIFKIQAVRLGSILTALEDELSHVASAKDLSFSIPRTDAYVRSDPSYLRRILQNLIGNALKYTSEGGVRVELTEVDDKLHLSVTDTGPGIAEEDQTVIFREFERRDHNPASTGLGLGLAIVDRAARGLGHAVHLTSRVGHGSSFTVTLPLAEAGLPATPRILSGQQDATASLRGKVIMIVENDRDLAHATSLLIEGAGGDVLVCHSMFETIRLLDEIDLMPDFFLLDQHLDRGETGLDLLLALRERRGHVPAAIVSADRSDAILSLCAEKSIPVLFKPIDERQILQTISRGMP